VKEAEQLRQQVEGLIALMQDVQGGLHRARLELEQAATTAVTELEAATAVALTRIQGALDLVAGGSPEAPLPPELGRLMARAGASAFRAALGPVGAAIAAGERDLVGLFDQAFTPIAQALARVPTELHPAATRTALAAVLREAVAVQLPPTERAASANGQAGAASRS
jgi:hypothetical protein